MRLKSLLSQPLMEIRFEDASPKRLVDLRNKYIDQLGKKGFSKKQMFIQFTDYRGNDDKTFVQNPKDHTDPAGVYAYPLEYALVEHPMDIWYGAGAKYARIIRSKAKSPLMAGDLRTSNGAKQFFVGTETRGVSQAALNRLRRELSISGKGSGARTAFAFFQNNSDGEVLSGAEQRNKLIKAGYDAVIDNGVGIIHEREPEQAIFLTRDSYEIVEVVEIDPSKKPDGALTSNSGNEEKITRKLAQAVARAIEDKLVTDTHRGVFFTKDGARITVSMNRPEKYYDRPMGSKHHKYDSDTTDHEVKINIYGPEGTSETSISSRYASFDDMASKAASDYYNSDAPSNFTAHNAESYKEAEELSGKLEMVNRLRMSHGKERISLEQYIKFTKDGINPVHEISNDDVSLRKWNEMIKKQHALAKLENPSVRRGSLLDFKEFVRANSAATNNGQKPKLFRDFFFKSPPKPGTLPVSIVMDKSAPYHHDEVMRMAKEILKKGNLEQTDPNRAVNSYEQMIKHFIKHDQPVPTFEEYLRNNYKWVD